MNLNRWQIYEQKSQICNNEEKVCVKKVDGVKIRVTCVTPQYYLVFSITCFTLYNLLVHLTIMMLT